MKGDFFSRLIERSLGDAEIVRPVLPPVFSPPKEGLRGDRDAVFPAEEPEMETDPAETGRIADRMNIEAAENGDCPDKGTGPGSSVSRESGRRERFAPAKDRPGEIAAMQATEGPGDRDPETESASGLHIAEASVVRPPAASEAVAREDRIEFSRPVRIHRNEDRQRAIAHPATVRRIDHGLADGNYGRPAADSRPEGSVPGKEAEPSAIKVHIGRIEVRAVLRSDPSERKKAAPPPSHMTLEKYLAQRGRGRE